jgi:hypothetical protein
MTIEDVNNQNRTSKDLKIEVAINNISNLLEHKTFNENYNLNIGDIYYSPDSKHLVYNFTDSDFVSDNNNLSILAPSEKINQGDKFKICINQIYSTKIIQEQVVCKIGAYQDGNGTLKITIPIPELISLPKLLINSSNAIHEKESENNQVKINEINISRLENYVMSDLDATYYRDFNWHTSDVVYLITNENPSNSYTVLKKLNMTNPNDPQNIKLASGDKISITNFEYDEQKNKIYATGENFYLVGNEYENRYGLGTLYNNHSVFVIDPVSENITKEIVLYGDENEDDESKVGEIFINNKSGEDEAYVTTYNKGGLQGFYVIDTTKNNIKSQLDINFIKGYRSFDIISYDKKDDKVYLCNHDTVIGFRPYSEQISNNFSSIYCPEVINQNNGKAYGINHGNVGILDLKKERVTQVLTGSNASKIILDNKNNSAYAIGYSDDKFDDVKNQGNITSFIYKTDANTDRLTAIYRIPNLLLKDIIVDPAHTNTLFLVGSASHKYNNNASHTTIYKLVTS